MPRSQLLSRTHALLKEKMAEGASLPAIYAELAAKGSCIKYFWLRKFSTGELVHTSVQRVEELYTHLSGRQLFDDAA